MFRIERDRRLVLLLSLVLSVPAIAASQSARTGSSGTLATVTVHSPALARNQIGDPAARRVVVYLPPSYAAMPAKRYPTLYLLHGFDDSPEVWTTDGFQHLYLRQSMDALVKAGKIQEMLVVVPDGSNGYLGSFYTNSAATGDWEDYIVRDLVAYVDEHYRTIPSPASRSIAGHSMGGYAAITLAMKHPDVFGALYAMSPCCLAFAGDLLADNNGAAWSRTLNLKSRAELKQHPDGMEDFYVDAFVALAAAFSPNVDHPPLFADFPYAEKNGALVRQEPAWSEWTAHMPLTMAPYYHGNLAQLHGIMIDYGLQDDFPHIPPAVRAFSEELARQGIPHTIAAYRGNHGDHIRQRLEDFALPFLSHVMQGEVAPAH